jgi:Tfp pilus assembly protein PilV
MNLHRNDWQGGLQRRGGVTLIEVMISILLISTILLISVNASATLLSNSTQQRTSNHSALLTAQILDEISAMDFRDRVNPVFGIEADEIANDRTTFDDVDDYNGYTSAPPTHRDGSAISGYDDWSISVTVVPADPVESGLTTTSADANSSLRVIGVICTAPEGTTINGATLVSDVPSDVANTTSYEQWRRIKLSFPQRELNVTAPLRNHPDSISTF